MRHARLVFADFEFGALVAGLNGVTLLDEAAQHDSRGLARKATDSDACARRSVPVDVYFRHHRSGPKA